MSTPLSILDPRQPLQPFRMADTLDRSFGVLSRHWLTFVLLVGLARVPLLLLDLFGPQPRIHHGRNLLLWVLEHLPITIAFVLLAAVLAAISKAIVFDGVFQELRGKEFSAKRSVSLGLARSLPVAGVALLVCLATFLGLFLLLVFAFFVMVVNYVAVPACVLERLGPVESMSRSWELTREHRWPIFGVIVASGLLNRLAVSLIHAALHAPSATSQVVEWLWGVALGSFMALFVAVLYHDLRLSKEGIALEQVVNH